MSFTTEDTEDTEDLLVKNMEYAAVIRSLRANAREDAAMIDRLQRERDEAREENKWLVFFLEHIRDNADIRYGKHRGLLAFSYLREEASRNRKEGAK